MAGQIQKTLSPARQQRYLRRAEALCDTDPFLALGNIHRLLDGGVNTADVYYLQATLLLKLGCGTFAAQAAEKALSAGGDRPTMLLLLLKCYLTAYHRKSAAKLIPRILEIDSLPAAAKSDVAHGAQEIHQGDAQVPAVEIAVEVEDMGLQDDLGVIEGGAAAQVGDPVAPLRIAASVDAGADRVDAERRQQEFPGEQVGGGEAHGLPALVAGLHPPFDLERAAEQPGGGGRIAVAQAFPDPGRGIDLFAVRHRGDGGEVEPGPVKLYARVLLAGISEVAENIAGAEDSAIARKEGQAVVARLLGSLRSQPM